MQSLMQALVAHGQFHLELHQFLTLPLVAEVEVVERELRPSHPTSVVVEVELVELFSHLHLALLVEQRSL
jgi:hypothetical protein